MASRPSRKSVSQVEQALSRRGRDFHIPVWGGEFCGFLFQPRRPIDPGHIQLRIQGRALTIKATTGSAGNEVSGVLLLGPGNEGPNYFYGNKILNIGPFPNFNHRFILPDNADADKGVAVWCENTLIVRFLIKGSKPPAIVPPMDERHDVPVIPIPIGFGPPTAPIVQLPEAKPHERKMAQANNIAVAKDGAVLKDGIRYLPLASAAPDAQTHPTTLLRWIKNQTKFEGRPLQSYYFAPADRYFVSEESIQRVANRFIKWSSQEPAGPVILGETDDRSGFIGLPDAERILGVSKRTMYLWATQGKAPTDKPLDVIQCPISEHFYIREKDVFDLKKLVPRSGLRPGRRPQLALQP